MKGSQWPTHVTPESIVPERFGEFRRECWPKSSRYPGVVVPGRPTMTPLLGGSWSHGIRVGAVSNSAQFTWVSPGYFNTMGISIRRGRNFTLRDSRNSPRVAIVNETFVKQFAGGSDPIGQTLRTGEEPRYPSTVYEIVGVIPNTRSNRPARRVVADGVRFRFQHLAQPEMRQHLIHSSVAPDVAVARVRERFRQVYPTAILEFSVFESRIRDRTHPRAFAGDAGGLLRRARGRADRRRPLRHVVRTS